MKQIIFAILLVITTANTHAQYADAIKADIAIYNEAYLQADFDKFVKYSIQSVVQLGGGAELMKDVAKEQSLLYANSSTKVTSLIPTWISPVYESEGAIHVVVGQQMELMIGSDHFNKTAYYLAESVDAGKSWSFIDLEAYDKDALSAYIPGISEELVIPEPDAAVKVE